MSQLVLSIAAEAAKFRPRLPPTSRISDSLAEEKKMIPDTIKGEITQIKDSEEQEGGIRGKKLPNDPSYVTVSTFNRHESGQLSSTTPTYASNIRLSSGMGKVDTEHN